jgi:hypothetical protein
MATLILFFFFERQAYDTQNCCQLGTPVPGQSLNYCCWRHVKSFPSPHHYSTQIMIDFMSQKLSRKHSYPSQLPRIWINYRVLQPWNTFSWHPLTMKAICLVTSGNEPVKVTPIQTNLPFQRTCSRRSFSIHETDVIFSYRASALTSPSFHSSCDKWTVSMSWGCLRPRPLDPQPSDSLAQCFWLFFVSQLMKIMQ